MTFRGEEKVATIQQLKIKIIKIIGDVVSTESSFIETLIGILPCPSSLTVALSRA